ncbi:MAG TPA: 1,4-alpha-glucan branching protein domain-containing protein [Solirubrobacteraceae bacterium]|nr:1,4-alpha-glucan branching protein domain-containing protein [Solirubrobacteraceae bacterium]
MQAVTDGPEPARAGPAQLTRSAAHPGHADRGELALLLHTHMPYVEGFGTWPFGEEWLWEAMAVSYLPLLELLERDPPVTLSLTPVLGDQLAAAGVAERFLRFMREVRRESHRIDIEGCRAGGEHELAVELERAALDYELAIDRFQAIDGDLLGALAPHVQWTSSATHSVLPLLATDAGAHLQIQTGIAAHRARIGEWRGGFWLPECAHAAWLDPLLSEAGVRTSCVDYTDLWGMGALAHLQPLCTESGVLLAPLDRQTIELVWSHHGYPCHGTYRDYHHHTVHHHQPWGNDGRPYDHEAALELVREHAADFVERTIARLDDARARTGRPGLVVCALDTELLGHWWYEGTAWLAAVLEEASTRGLAVARLDDALERHDPAPAPADPPVTTWGSPRDLTTWDGPAVADLAWRARAAELRVVAERQGGGAERDGARAERDGARAERELLALQSSDWAFMVTRELAGPYPLERSDGHARALESALRNGRGPERARGERDGGSPAPSGADPPSVGSRAPGIRNLAAHATPAPLLAP